MNKQITCNQCGYQGLDIHDDLYDCIERKEVDNGIRKGQWMIDWVKRLKEAAVNKKPYESDFVKWSNQFK
jgi:hypothetical protein